LQSRILFLAGSAVLHRPVNEVTALLTAIGQTFPIEPRPRGGATGRADHDDQPHFDGIHAHLDDFDFSLPDREGWRQLASHGLVRLSLGVKSGDSDVRGRYQKAWSDDSLRATVAAIKSAGLGVSVLILVGAGGVELARPHLEQTVSLVQSLALSAGDFVFLLDEKEVNEPQCITQGLTRLEGIAWSDEQAKLKQGLALMKRKGVKVLPYTVEKQWT
jgi:hypothetical protein